MRAETSAPAGCSWRDQLRSRCHSGVGPQAWASKFHPPGVHGQAPPSRAREHEPVDAARESSDPGLPLTNSVGRSGAASKHSSRQHRSVYHRRRNDALAKIEHGLDVGGPSSGRSTDRVEHERERGATITLSSRKIGSSAEGGSVSKTSSPAPAIRPFSSASVRAT